MYWKDTQENEYGKVEQTFLPPYDPVVLTDVDVAYPAHVVGKLLPRWEDMPEDFRRQTNEWCHLVDRWFADGLEGDQVPKVKPELNAHHVWRHLKACMGSYQPAHEHKVAGVAYLLSLWMEPMKGTHG